ncbi:MAG: hypothetical protein KC964_21500, partial [Candidatus Omnitrophica bacterium]|nr:hypothetical protein [Candidatus Omnitrophota bacterium]
QVNVTAEGPLGGMVSDLSDAGEEPDANGNGFPGDAGEDDPTVFAIGSYIGIAKDVSVVGNQVTFDYYLETFGSFGLTDVNILDDLGSALGDSTFSVLSPATLIDDPGTISTNPSFDGVNDTSLLSSGGTLTVGDTAQVQITIVLTEITNQGA